MPSKGAPTLDHHPDLLLQGHGPTGHAAPMGLYRTGSTSSMIQAALITISVPDEAPDDCFFLSNVRLTLLGVTAPELAQVRAHVQALVTLLMTQYS